ncbi:LOW QUALITY PROTEIN: hypothetical protein ACHAXA_006033, partial [Cyclostephanos tholiformis]
NYTYHPGEFTMTDDGGSSSWDRFLLSTAISYSPPPAPVPVGGGGRRRRRMRTRRRRRRRYRGYWDPDLLGRWRSLYPGGMYGERDDDAVGSPRGGASSSSSSSTGGINYGSYILLASSIAMAMRRRLSLDAARFTVERDATSSVYRGANEREDDDDLDCDIITTKDPSSDRDVVSHVVYTSGTTGIPKGCVSSLGSLRHYLHAKNLDVTHVLCTPALWSTVDGRPTVDDYPSLRVIALGGEPIPRSMLGRWARRRRRRGIGREGGMDDGGGWDREHPRLCATYGTTEACVYQSFGEVYVIEEEGGETSSTSSNGDVKCGGEEEGGGTMPSSTSSGTNVGLPLLGTNICICRPYPEDDCDDNANNDCFDVPALELVERDADSSGPTMGEVVISGAQVDSISSYLNSAKLTARVFVRCPVGGLCSGSGDSYFYRTGDLGCIDPMTGELRILGRIKDGMVKINGMRIELSEIENACIDYADDDEGRLVVDCIATVDGSSDSGHKQLIAYCLLSLRRAFGIDFEQQISGHTEPKSSSILSAISRRTAGVIVAPGPLLSLLRARCDRRVRRGCTPSFFVIIDRLPLSSTGKRSRSMLPPLAVCSIMKSSANSNEERSLWNCGKLGSIVANKICECLNLQPCQRQFVTLDANFFALGGDSLAATRVVRGLHAKHHGIMDSRNLGGGTGTLDGPFAAKHLLKSETLGAYIEFLASKSAFQTSDDAIIGSDSDEFGMNTTPDHKMKENVANPLYVSLLESITLGYTRVACSFLDLEGVDPNTQTSQFRLGKVSDRQQRRRLFKSNPLHLACLRGNSYLVKRLLDKGCKANIPDASGSFPIHLACSRIEDNIDDVEEDLNRLECVKLLLNKGKTPISIKDGNKQTILHCAARSGHCNLLVYIMNQWRVAAETIGIKFEHINAGGDFDWRDRWYRTPVHWAVLNQRVAALQILLVADVRFSAKAEGECQTEQPVSKVVFSPPLLP